MAFQRFKSAPAAAIFLACVCLPSLAQDFTPAIPPVVQHVTAANTKVDLTVNASRILKTDGPIPRAQVGNPDLLAFSVLSENEVQIHAKKAGITTVNLWNDKNEVRTVDVIITGDVRELEGLLKAQFPTASIKLYPTQASTLVLYGYVDRPDYVNTIMQIAEDYYPKVINNMIVGGSQQVLLHVKVMEVSRTNLKQLGFDFSSFSGNNFATSSASQIITPNTSTISSLFRSAESFGTAVGQNIPTFQFGIVNDPSGFVAFLDALKDERLLKVLAEPNLVTVSGRPASYLVGGEMPVPQPTGFGNISIMFKPFGTQIDFVPIILGNGGVRLEVRPQVSEIDASIGTEIAGTAVPGFRERMVDTGVEMKFGQTLAIAGLLQQKTEAEKRGIPYLMDLPYVGAAFRNTRNRINEIELLIMVRPELVEAMDPDQVPCCAPGLNSQSPDDCGLYWKGYIETPVQPYGRMGHGPGQNSPDPAMYQNYNYGGQIPEQVVPAPAPAPANGGVEEIPSARRAPARSNGSVVVSDRGTNRPTPASTARRPNYAQRGPTPARTVAPPYNPSNPAGRQTSGQVNTASAPPGFIGPIGYDVKK